MNEQSPVSTPIKRVWLVEKLRRAGWTSSGSRTRPPKRRFAPGELFRLTEGSKLVRVWLE